MRSARKPSIVFQYKLFGPPEAKYLRGMWVKSQRRAQRANIPFTIKPEDAERLYEAQDGRCALTGLAFNFDEFPLAFVKCPFGPSIDRRDPHGGYTPDNVRLVCVAVNFGLGQWGDETYLRLARAAVAKADAES